MDAREAFKFGFLARCIDAGYTTPAEIHQAIKTAMVKSAGGLGLGDVAKGIGELGSSALGWGIPLALAAPPVAGYMAGNLAAKATDVDDYDTDEAKRQELVDEYKRQAARTRRQGLVRKYQQARQQSGRMFL